MRPLRRIAVLSLHTSPLAVPGGGDAGGMNVYVRAVSRELVAMGAEVDVFTRSTFEGQAQVERPRPGVRVVHLGGAPADTVAKEDLPLRLPRLAADLRRFADADAAGRYDVIHSHYWLSGTVGLELQRDWQVPLVHSMHTMAKVKNLHLQPGEAAEPPVRIRGEQDIADGAARLVANTLTEASELKELYGTAPERIDVVPPGVDLAVFHPAGRALDRREAGVDDGLFHICFAGRIQALKGPQVLLAAVARLLRQRPGLKLQVTIIGDASGANPLDLGQQIDELGLAGRVRLLPPVTAKELARHFRSADVVAVPSFSESFGLVALEAQACGTPVVATNVGGLPSAVSHGVTGLLVDGHAPDDWASAFGELFEYPAFRTQLGSNAAIHAAAFGWEQTAALTVHSYQHAMDHFSPV
ncbi:glycosyltransferase [Arthrobacter crystallopoietes BAB-32]|uniref:D-inositol-3-phosphate glycosyltransferase n=1 Tax=Arthrobacter crystallopoietes BAB-32 TaxID=1246476 RepID=N1UX04_9MICC|nr:D-inositol-3-phosphate glycosyltransferase [Arthrobacter crystallopoietes]EMY33600.1 glycosyltransferase [Arthrobacter crystallopoietes BAB-32]